MRTVVLAYLRCVATTLILFLALTGSASAQSIVDATRVEFTPSVDHNVVDNGVNVVTEYSLEVYLAGGATALQTISLGKPAPGSDGMIRLDFVALLPTPLLTGVTYEVLVQAVGPGGSSGGTRSNTFAFTPVVTCTPSMSPTSQSVVAAGGTGSATVTVAAGCAWTAVSNDSWITVTAGASVTGPGTASFSVAANTVTTQRTGTLTIAGATFTVTQAAAACSYAISPTSQTVVAAGGTASTTVTTSSNCAWTTSESANWISISSGASGTGSGPVTLTVSANTGTSQRSAVVTVAGKSFTVTQPAPCTVTLTPTSVTVLAAGSSSSITVGTQSTCAWTSSSNVAWITATASGTGSGSASYSVAANTGTTGRTGTFTVGGVTVTVTQGVKPAAPTNVRIVK